MLTLDKETIEKIREVLKDEKEINFEDFIILKKSEMHNKFWEETFEAAKEKGERIEDVDKFFNEL